MLYSGSHIIARALWVGAGRWSTRSTVATMESLSPPAAFLMLERSDSSAAILPSRADTYSGEMGVRFQSSARNSHLTPASEQLRQGVVREHLIWCLLSVAELLA